MWRGAVCWRCCGLLWFAVVCCGVTVCCELLWFVVCWLWFRHLSRIFRAYTLTCTSNLRVQTYMRMSIHACNATCAHTALHAHINRACKSTRAHQPTHTALHAHQSTHTTLHAHINPRIQPTCAHQTAHATAHAHINRRRQHCMRTLIHAYSPTCACQSKHATLHAHISPRTQPYMRTSTRACNSTCAH